MRRERERERDGQEERERDGQEEREREMKEKEEGREEKEGGGWNKGLASFSFVSFRWEETSPSHVQ